MIDIKTILTDLINTKGDLQEFINRRYKSKGDYFIRTCNKDTFKYIGTDYAMFHLDNMVTSIEGSNVDYDISDLKPDDVVLDIGACIGGFALKAARKCKHVYCLEPIFYKELQKNIELNGFKNITVLPPYALGKYEVEIDFDKKCLNFIKDSPIPQKTLTEILELCGEPITFLKCDCEGGEWVIRWDELKGIRCIEMEVHKLTKEMPEMDTFYNVLRNTGFTHRTQPVDNTCMIVHARHL